MTEKTSEVKNRNLKGVARDESASTLNMPESSSTYYFIAQLSPEDECRTFYPGELQIGDGWVLDICFDLMSIWNPSVQTKFGRVRPSITEAFNLLTDLYTFDSNKLLTYRLRNWVEAKEVCSPKNMIGVFKTNLTWKKHPSGRHPNNRRWRRVAKAFPAFRGNPQLRLAVKDYVSAIRDSGDDAFFFAYRAVESICRNASGSKGEKISDSDWKLMHQKLGTTKSSIDPLTKVAKEIRHGNINSQTLVNARSDKERLLGIARDVLTAEFKRSVKGF